MPNPVPPNVDAVQVILSLRINDGPFEGGYQVAPLGMLSWYFTNLGLLSIVQDLSVAERNFYIVPYLNLYLQNLEANAAIQDVVFSGGLATQPHTLQLSDSDDSYAATYLSLVARYLTLSQDWNWWDANLPTLKHIADANIATAVKASGLTSVFQAPRMASNSTGYLMDNCEVYRGLRDFAALLHLQGDADGLDYDAIAADIAAAIRADLYASADQAFKISDLHPIVATSFYPGTTCQVFPQAFDVQELADLYAFGWAYLNAVTPGWQHYSASGELFPWAILGYVAAKRGDTAKAQAMLAKVNQQFANSGAAPNRAQVIINELGYYRRIQNVLAGLPPY